jgi:Zn-dependent protease with chaperone function
MKLCRVLLSGLLITSSFILSTSNHGVYYTELKALKKAPATKQIFDEDAHFELSRIQCDITIYKNLTSFQRFVRGAFLSLDVIIVTPETLPRLYEYVDGICKNAHIATPTVFLTRQDGFFNAAAQKLLMSTGGIVIGQKLLHDLSDDAVEAIVAHEIGHIKHNHINKGLALVPVTIAVMAGLFVAFIKKTNAIREVSNEIIIDGVPTIEIISQVYAGLYVSAVAASLIPGLVINKRFEKEADEFACKNDKSKGIIEFFELILQKDQLREEEFTAIYELLQQNKSQLSFDDYFDLIIRYYMAKAGHLYGKAYKYIYYNTFIGAHPSPEARIAAAKEYLATHTTA